MFACFPGKKQSFRFLAPHLYRRYWSEALPGNEECTRSPRHERHESFKKAFRKVSTTNTRTLHVPSRSYMSTLTYPMTVFQTAKKKPWNVSCTFLVSVVSRQCLSVGLSGTFMGWTPFTLNLRWGTEQIRGRSLSKHHPRVEGEGRRGGGGGRGPSRRIFSADFDDFYDFYSSFPPSSQVGHLVHLFLWFKSFSFWWLSEVTTCHEWHCGTWDRFTKTSATAKLTCAIGCLHTTSWSPSPSSQSTKLCRLCHAMPTSAISCSCKMLKQIRVALKAFHSVKIRAPERCHIAPHLTAPEMRDVFTRRIDELRSIEIDSLRVVFTVDAFVMRTHPFLNRIPVKMVLSQLKLKGEIETKSKPRDPGPKACQSKRSKACRHV